jgi:hypothetical protein
MKMKEWNRGKQCQMCNIDRCLTRHHVKSQRGVKTGDIQILCRDCHDEVEEIYRINGMIQPVMRKSVKRLLETSNLPFDNSKPYYSLKGNSAKI